MTPCETLRELCQKQKEGRRSPLTLLLRGPVSQPPPSPAGFCGQDLPAASVLQHRDMWAARDHELIPESIWHADIWDATLGFPGEGPEADVVVADASSPENDPYYLDHQKHDDNHTNYKNDYQ